LWIDPESAGFGRGVLHVLCFFDLKGNAMPGVKTVQVFFISRYGVFGCLNDDF